MKLLAAAAASLLTVVAMNVSVFADGVFVDPAEYNGGNDSATVDATDYSTILITKESDSDSIVYIDQSDSVFSGSIPFLIKANPDVGKYTVRLGSESGGKSTYFYVGADSNNPNDIYMKRLQNEGDNEDGTYNIGYYATVTADQYNNCNCLKVGYVKNGTNTYGRFDLDQNWDDTFFSGSGEINLIFQLNDVDAAYKDSVAVYLSADGSSSQGGN